MRRNALMLSVLLAAPAGAQTVTEDPYLWLEGVEDAKAWDRLRDLRCDQAQGYHMGKPMPANDFVAWSARWVERRRMPGAPAATTLLH